MIAREPRERRPGRGFVIGFAFVAVAIVTAGVLYFRSYQQSFRHAVAGQLSATAELKVGELVRYRRERLADGALFHRNTAFSSLVRRFLGERRDEEAGRLLRIWVAKSQTLSEYDGVFLLDSKGVVRMSEPSSQHRLSSTTIARVPEVLRTDAVDIQDFYRSESDGRVHLAVLVPIDDDSGGGPPLGILVLRVDPADALYPFLQKWPVPTRTAETLLVRRDGDSVLYLNEVRFRQNTALTLRLPLNRAELPAAQAVLGRAGLFEGKDYRGVPVVAHLMAVPQSPWFLVARMDVEEADAPLRERAWLTTLLAFLMLAGTGSATGWIWLRQAVRFKVEQARLEEIQRVMSYTRSLIEASLDPLVTIGADGTITDANAATEKITGRERGDLIGTDFCDYFTEPGRARAGYKQVFAVGVVRDFDLLLRHEDGHVTPVQYNATVYRDASGRVAGVFAAARDVTERIAARDELERHRERLEELVQLRTAELAVTVKKLEHSNRDLEQFASVASHDLQEPLRMVASYSQLLAEKYRNQLDETAQKYIDYAVDGAHRMQRLINDLLAFARVNSRARPIEQIDAHAVLGEAIRNLQGAIRESGALVTNDDLPNVHADAGQLLQLFQNLMSNAIKFRSTAPPRIHVSARDLGSEWQFSVRDNGIGIEEQYADRIFVLFQRLHTRAEYPGTGIGLAICKRVVERHGGRISFTSAPGQGSTFFFTIPKRETGATDAVSHDAQAD